MKATEALQAARSFNVQINLCGDNLALDAPEAPPERVLDALRENKLQILRSFAPQLSQPGTATMRGLPLSATLPGLAIGLFQQSRNSHADWSRMGSLTNTFGRAPSDCST